ncbi:uncharacterized protein BJ212DRAFT_1474558 [Suillus subaureus]|uniref:Uncharacterized protein n=1 Tax=Suillus subaureus TaxID=48587 RepID=A0A9P7EQK1_9AGAM|nr:uncharacterized protein BJ212DRAFT_1474558 [Suillus subaureus]KAG1827405.1 hypothetical protein BJ212DRAFT_1474558 [Suillus subaureus]
MSLTVESVTTQEEACQLRSFDSNVAWEIGNIIRANAQQKFTRPVVIYIAHANSSQLLFFATSGPGTLPDNMHWVKRKEAVVLRWGCSTMRMRLSMQAKAKTLQEVYEMSDPSIYAVHGGGFPVKVKGVEGVVGVIVVSGLAQEDDHSVIVDGIQEYLARNP